MRTTFKYEIWSKGESFNKQPEATLKFTCYSLQECADVLCVKVSAIRDMVENYNSEWFACYIIDDTTYQIKRLLNT